MRAILLVARVCVRAYVLCSQNKDNRVNHEKGGGATRFVIDAVDWIVLVKKLGVAVVDERRVASALRVRLSGGRRTTEEVKRHERVEQRQTVAVEESQRSGFAERVAVHRSAGFRTDKRATACV